MKITKTCKELSRIRPFDTNIDFKKLKSLEPINYPENVDLSIILNLKPISNKIIYSAIFSTKKELFKGSWN